METAAELEQINTRLATARVVVRRHDHLRRQLFRLADEIEAAESELAERLEIVKVEAKDVERLEGRSFRRFAAIIAGSHDERLAKEQFELAAAEGRASEAADVCTELRQAIDQTEAQLSRFTDVLVELDAATWAKESWLLRHNSAVSAELGALLDEHAEVSAERSELREAADAGITAQLDIGDLRDRLRKAKGWSGFDLWVGGGALSSVVKHQHLDEAVRALGRAESSLERFNRELADTWVPAIHDQLVATRRSWGLDIFFDNIFTDASVDSRVKTAFENANLLGESVAQTRQTIADRLHELDKRADVISALRTQLLDQA